MSVGRGMATLHEALPEAVRDEYWGVVKRVLVHVFHDDAQKADIARTRLEDFERGAGEPQTFFYHADPFEVAADLAGRRGREITSEQKQRYQDLIVAHDKPPGSQVHATYPQNR
jgi:hypothetical protein